MFNNIFKKFKDKKGFTLVELLIVIAVLGIIAAIAVPRFTGVLSGVKSKADLRAAELWVKEIEAEFMVEDWSFGSGTEIVVNSAYTNFGGTIPTSQADGTTPLRAVITRTGTAEPYSYTIQVYTSTDTSKPLFTTAKSLNPPVK